MKKNFYIFLDIDGVLYDWEYIKTLIRDGKIKKGGKITAFKPESIEALNYLIEKKSKDFNVNLVISSTWRHYMDSIIEKLNLAGLRYNGEFTRTPISGNPKQRGFEIKRYLSDKMNFDYVIIDDEICDYYKYFEPHKIIKTELYEHALDKEMIDTYLSKVNKR